MIPIPDLQRTLRPFVAAIPAAGLLLGLAALFGPSSWSGTIWAAGTIPVVLVLLLEIVTSLRRGDIGLDIVAAISMTAALIFGERLAAVVVALMYGGGQYLESFAERQARREMTDLLGRVPRTAIRHLDGALQEVAVEALEAGDRILVRQGDVVPVDGTVLAGVAVLDQSALTGESVPVQHAAGEPVMSGSANIGAAFDLSATRRAHDSTYAGIVRLVEAAQQSRAPMSRLADRFAIVFLAVTLLLAGAAWMLSADPIRAVAVMDVATPCPLILAVPVAIAAGLSRAAKQGILVKGGKALETLAQVRSLVIDKTGTLTHGRARLTATKVVPRQSPDEILRVAASLDQASKHAIAQTLVEEARQRGLDLSVPTNVAETPGEGIEGELDGRRVIVGGLRFVAARTRPSKHSLLPPARAAGAIAVAVAIDGELVGTMVLADELRDGTEVLLRRLRETGIERIVVASGDRRDVAETVSKGLSIDLVRSELTPDQKVLAVLSERKNGPVMMIGDGVNDAPALAAADIGLAMGANGAAAAAEAADIVLLVDQLDRVLAAVEVARRSRFIALQSVVIGLGLSMVGMVAAALGFLVPVEGAVLQELIDLAVIFNALRALSAGRSSGQRARS